MTRLALALATVGGAGFFPIAPGTVGSAIGIVIYLLTMHWAFAWQISLVAIVSIVGVVASGLAADALGRKDPGPVVIDEVAGQLMTLLLTGVGWPGAIIGFFLFRVLDIIKPWPAGRFESFHGGLGIMADDLMAGIYGNIALIALARVLPWAL